MTEQYVMTEQMIAQYRKLCEMDVTVEGLDGITVGSCFNNGQDSALEQGLKPGTAEFEDVAAYFTVRTAIGFEIPGI